MGLEIVVYGGVMRQLTFDPRVVQTVYERIKERVRGMTSTDMELVSMY
jgi:hypothetical protein